MYWLVVPFAGLSGFHSLIDETGEISTGFLHADVPLFEGIIVVDSHLLGP